MPDTDRSPASNRVATWPADGGAMGALIRAYDWSSTPLGTSAGWPASLRAVVDLILDAPLAMIVLWGPDLIQIYNDGYRAMMGAKHPSGLGQPTRACWPEVWHFNAPIYEAVWRGETRSFRSQKLTIERRGVPEDAWFDLTFSALRAEAGAIAGILVTVVEATAEIRASVIGQQAEERLRAVLESTTDSVLVLDRDWTIVFQNRRATDLINGGRNLLGTNLWDEFPEARGSRFWDEYRRAMREQVPVEFTAFLPSLGRWFEVHGYPAPDQLTLFFRDVTAARRQAQELREAEARLRAVLDQMPVGVSLATVPSGELVYHNSKAVELIRHPLRASADYSGYAQYGAIHADGRAYAPEEYPIARTVLSGAVVNREEMRYRRGDGTLTHFEVSSAPIRDADGRTVMAISTFEDISERKATEERQQLLMREVDHRAKNALAVVQAVMKLTRADTTRAFIDAVHGRVDALARAHALLAQGRWTGADVRTLVCEELTPYLTGAPDRLQLSGPDVSVTADTGQPLGMVLHELATNAAKYGALSGPSGRVEVGWERTVDGGLRLEWWETGGPPVHVPDRRGFGSELIDASASSQLDGSVHFDWRPEGLRCTLVIGPQCLMPAEAAEGAASGSQAAPGADVPLEGRRVLLVEDDVILALSLKQELEALGCTVIGPAGSLEAALRLAATRTLDVAVLDRNLAGSSALPVADLLQARGVPHLFATGYGEQDFGDRAVPVLEKPFTSDKLAAALRSTIAGLYETGS